MANLIAAASTAWLTSTTWGVVEAGASAVQTTRSSGTNTTTSYVYSSAFTVTNADVIDGILLHVKRVNTTGTVTVALSEDGGTTATREVTVNASDLPAGQSWVFFKFGSTLTGDGGSDYKIGIKGSSAGNATFYRDGTAGNWARLLRTTATAAPAAGDNIYIAGEWTAAATVTSIEVTGDALASSITDHGTLDIGKNGTLSIGVTASTAYYLRFSGDVTIWSGGTLNEGTVASPMPASSSFSLNIDCGSDVQWGVLAKDGSTWRKQGASKTTKAFLAANASASATTVTTDVSTGWKSGDELAFASTTRTYTQCEKKTMSGDATGTSVPVAALTYAHSGTAPTQGEVANLTRNIKMFGASLSLRMYTQIDETAIVDWDYAEVYWHGGGGAGKAGFEIGYNTGVSSFSGNLNINGCSVHDLGVSSAFVHRNHTSGAVVTINNLVTYNIDYHTIYSNTGSGTVTYSDILAIYNQSGNAIYIIQMESNMSFSDITVVGCGSSYGQYYAHNGGNRTGTFTGLTAHSCAVHGIGINVLFGTAASWQYWSDFTVWRNTNTGCLIFGGIYYTEIDGVVAFGNGDHGIYFNGLYHCRLLNFTCNGETANGYGSTHGFRIATNSPNHVRDVVLFNFDLGSTQSGSRGTHTNADLIVNVNDTGGLLQVVAHNVKMSSATAPSITLQNLDSFFAFQNYNQTTGDHRLYTYYGRVQSDSVIYNTAAPSLRITPTNASNKTSAGKKVAVNSGDAVTITAWVRKSAVADAGGANYAGSQPRLMCKANPSIGIGTNLRDVVIATYSAGTGAWNSISGTTAAVTGDGVLEFYIDCDGTAGWVNVDDWETSDAQEVGAEKYWSNGNTELTLAVAAAPGGGGALGSRIVLGM